MATISTYKFGGTAGHMSRREVRGVYVVDFTINMANVAGQTGGGGDTIQLMNFPANTYILAAGLNVITASVSGSGTVKVTDGTNDYTTAATTTSAGQQTVTGTPHLQTAAGTLDLVTATASIPTGTLQVWAIIADVAQFETISVA